MEKCSVRDAALKIADWFSVEQGSAPESKPESAGARKRRRGKPQEQEQEPVAINPPLGFQLRVNAEHEYGAKRGLTAETIAEFGAGMCISKGTFAGRYVVPLHDEQGQLVGYAGRSLDDSEPRYLFPAGKKGFRKSRLLFNLHRLLAKEPPASWTVVVEGFFDAMHVVQAGYPCVGLLGSTLSVEQEELLCKNFDQVVLLFDGDTAGRKATDDCLLRLGRRVYVRAIELPDGQQPDSLSFEELTQLLEP